MLDRESNVRPTDFSGCKQSIPNDIIAGHVGDRLPFGSITTEKTRSGEIYTHTVVGRHSNPGGVALGNAVDIQLERRSM